MTDRKTVMSWLEGLTQDDWQEWYSNSEVQNTAQAALKLLKEQEARIGELEEKLRVLEYGDQDTLKSAMMQAT